MKKSVIFSGLLVIFITLTSMTVHKFYVSIYQVNYEPKKKMLQITSRIFIDDLNDALTLRFKKKIHIGENNETPEDIAMLKTYLSENFSITVNNQKKSINYLSKEREGNVVICFFNCKDITKINSIEIRNSALIEWNNEQQNIIQTKIYDQKHSLLLQEGELSGMLNF